MTWQDAYRTIIGTPRTRVGPATTARLLSDPSGSGNTWTGIETSPVALHAAAATDRDLYAIGRCIISEVGDANGYAALAAAETLWNAARRKGLTPYQWLVGLTNDARDWTKWKYGEQSGRRASTRQDPTLRAITAAKVRQQAGVGFVNGATTWYDPKTQDSGKQGRNDLRFDAVGIANKWAADGYQWIGPLPGIDSYRTVVYLKHVPGRANVEPLLALIKAGRRGEPTLGPASTDERVRAVASSGQPWWIVAGGAAALLL